MGASHNPDRITRPASRDGQPCRRRRMGRSRTGVRSVHVAQRSPDVFGRSCLESNILRDGGKQGVFSPRLAALAGAVELTGSLQNGLTTFVLLANRIKAETADLESLVFYVLQVRFSIIHLASCWSLTGLS